MGEFEDELEEYLNQRRKGNVMSFLATKKLEKQQTPDSEPEYEPIQEMPQPQKQGFFARLFSASPADEVPEEELIRADLKDIAKIALDALKQLPPQELENFKKSEDFFRFKELLQKHQLIKPKLTEPTNI